jgi:DNA-binding transcriptional regulator YdaS (Cro superfamily)
MEDGAHAERVRAYLRTAIEQHGSEGKLGRATGYTQNAIWQAKRRGRVTAEMAVAIERATEGRVGRHLLRPDVFSAEQAQ